TRPGDCPAAGRTIGWIRGARRGRIAARLRDARGKEERMEPTDRSTIHYTELPEAQPDSPFRAGWEFYRREVGHWLAEGLEGKWVLIKGEEVIGIYDTRDEAREEACKRYLIPRQPCLIRQILTRERMLRVPWMWMYRPSRTSV